MRLKLWRKTLIAGSIALLTIGIINPALADADDQLPDIGTTASNALTIPLELIMGDFYMRQLRASAPLITDPVLNDYLNQLGQRLVSHATSVKTPFHFHLMDNDNLNAFAFFGGNVVLHSALFRYADNESQLAAVMSHEISHVTQRHLARFIEDRQRNAPLTWIGILGSVLLSMASPQAGLAGLTSTMAATEQRIITFTQRNEQEADRLGIGVLHRSGFDPQAMPDFLQKLLDQIRYSTRPPEILLTHPLPESRLADARDRANQMKNIVVQSSADFYMAKARAFAMYRTGSEQTAKDLFTRWQKGNIRQQQAAQYGLAIQAMRDKKYDAAEQLLQPLLNQQPDNPWLLDIITDIDIGKGQPGKAVKRLKAAADLDKNLPLQINLANALLEEGKYADVVQQLNRYTFDHPDDTIAWTLLLQAQSALGHQDQVLAAQAELNALAGDLDGAIRQLSNASARAKLGSLQQARYDARIDQLRRLRDQFRQFRK